MITEFREITEQLADFLDAKCAVPIVLIDEQRRIIDCNNGFLRLFSLSRKPLGATLADFLIADSGGIIFEKGSHEFHFNPQTRVQGVLLAHTLPYTKGLLLWCDRHFTTDNQVVETMALINNELISTQRELAKKNHQLNLTQHELEEKVAQLESTLSYVKRLEGILPVCMYCKKIRDDSGTEPGEGEWMRMETYLYSKSGTIISHGCCPECFEEHKVG